MVWRGHKKPLNTGAVLAHLLWGTVALAVFSKCPSIVV